MRGDKLDEAERSVVWTHVLCNMRDGETLRFTPTGYAADDVLVTYERASLMESGVWKFGEFESPDINKVLDYLMKHR